MAQSETSIVGCREWARVSFERFAEIERTHGPKNTGVKLISGHIQSDNRALLENAVGASVGHMCRDYRTHWAQGLFP